MWYWKPLEVWSRTFFERDKVNFSQNITIFKTGAVNKDIKYKRKLIRQPSFSDNLQSSNNILRLFDVLDTVKSVVRNADIWKNTKILFFKYNEIYWRYPHEIFW